MRCGGGLHEQRHVAEPLFVRVVARRHVVGMPQLPGGPHGFTPDQLCRLEAPALVLGAEHDRLWRGAEAVAAARAALPDCEAELMPGVHHIPDAAGCETISCRVLEFFAGRGLT